VLGVVLVIGIVSTTLLVSLSGTDASVSDESAKAYWQGVARPVRIPEAVYGEDRALHMVVENADPDPLSLQSLQFDGAVIEFYVDNETNASEVYLSGGERKVLRVGLPEYYCRDYGPVQAQLNLNYLSAHGTPSTQKGEKPLVIECTISTLVGREGNGTGGNQSQNQTQNQTLNTTLSACGITLSQPGTYTLANNVVASGTCFTITGKDVTLDCGGKNMAGSGSGYGVMIQAKRASVRNCVMSNFAGGVYSDGNAELTISSNDIDVPSNGRAMYLGNNLTGSSISSNSITGTGTGLYISGSGASSTGVSISGNSISLTTTMYTPNMISGISGSTISGNSFIVANNNGACGATALATLIISDSTISGNTITNNGALGCGWQVSGQRLTISGNSATTSGTCVAFFETGCTSCQITGGTYTGNPGLGAQLSGDQVGTVFSDNTFRGSSVAPLAFWPGIRGATFTGNVIEDLPGGTINAGLWMPSTTWLWGNGNNANITFRDNTFRLLYYNVPAIVIGDASTDNLFYQNTIRADKWVENGKATNLFVSGGTGNSYYTSSGTPASSFLNMTDGNGDGWADSGSSVPFSSATIPPYWSGVGSDAHPHIG